MIRSTVGVAAILALLLTGLLLVGSRWLEPLERQFAGVRYAVRGDRRADTSIVMVYVDNDAVKTLGWPIRRNFHALLLHTLSELQPRAIGIELVFEDSRMGYQEFPEYDSLLASTIRKSGNVVLASYFDEVGGAKDSAESLPASAGYPRVHAELPAARGPHWPLPGLGEAAAGVGHVNFLGEAADQPAVVEAGSTVVPSFPLEVLRVASGTARADVIYRSAIVLLDRSGDEREIPLAADGSVPVDFPGPLRSFVHYPFLDVLRAYDALKHGETPSIPIQQFRNKILLVGVIADGRSEFRWTPVDARTPSLVIHGAFLDNALHGRFPSVMPAWIRAGVMALVIFLCGLGVLLLRRPLNVMLPFTGLLLLVGASLLLFGLGGWVIPVVADVLGGLLAIVVALIFRSREEGSRVEQLAEEKQSILARLRDREEKVAALEREMAKRPRSVNEGRTEDVLEEIRKYKAEIAALSTQAQDLEPFDAAADTPVRGEAFEGIVFAPHGVMKPVVEFVAKISSSDAPVLILGESGTGKELVARALHRRSGRAGEPFVAVNCGALAETLLESELFGHEKGAFTGAVKEKPGRFELANRGTIFLDEIGEVSEAFQLKLLRVLQEGELERVGGTASLRVDVRLVTATNRDLREAVRAGRFREDLFYRLNVLTVSLPPLRERRDDIALLVTHFLSREGGESLAVSRGVMEILQAHSWPGNIRELESTIRRAVLLAKADGRNMIIARDLPDELAAGLRGASPVQDQVLDLIRSRGFSRSAITESALELGGLNRGTVAEYLRGECLRLFVEAEFRTEDTVSAIALSAEPAIRDRVRKRLAEYLENIASAIDPRLPWEAARTSLKSKMKNLPQRYHPYVEQVGEAYHRRIWTLDPPGDAKR